MVPKSADSDTCPRPTTDRFPDPARRGGRVRRRGVRVVGGLVALVALGRRYHVLDPRPLGGCNDASLPHLSRPTLSRRASAGNPTHKEQLGRAGGRPTSWGRCGGHATFGFGACFAMPAARSCAAAIPHAAPCPGQKPPFLAVKRPARPYKNTVQK
jgi:hypothetical protein